MKLIKIYLSVLIGLFLFASCEKEIIFKGETTEPLVVVNSYITPDSVISAHLSESRFFLDTDATFTDIKNAEVSVWVNGVLKENLQYFENGNYKGTYKPAIGESIKLIVKVPSKKDVSCEATVTAKPEINSLDTTGTWTGRSYEMQYVLYNVGGYDQYKYDTVATINGHKINYTLKFKDKPEEKNYYRLVVLTKEYYYSIDSVSKDTITEIRDNYSFNFTDVVSGNNSNNDPQNLIENSLNNPYNVFSDELFNGKTYSLTFTTLDDLYNYKPGYQSYQKMPDKRIINVYLQSIGKDYYLYLKSRPIASGAVDFFSEAVQIHNNITGGVGILGSYTSGNVIKIELNH